LLHRAFCLTSCLDRLLGVDNDATATNCLSGIAVVSVADLVVVDHHSVAACLLNPYPASGLDLLRRLQGASDDRQAILPTDDHSVR